ncbi:hypothetical protein [Pedobacter sp. N23S346]|uniref:hypothetical protein n=1 Tax=Pedobacter sp. N23S346 TaxID=3402750 RepID=UPI003ACA23A1
MSRFKFFDEETENSTNSDQVKLFLKENENLNKRFMVQNHICFYALGQKVTDVKTDMIWIVKSIKKNTLGIIVDVEIESHEVLNANPGFNDMVEFAKAFNYPMAKLVLQLNERGRVDAVLNQGEILERWNEIKQDVLTPLQSSDQDKEVLRNGDIQFNNSLNSIQESLIYNLFFAPVFGGKKISQDSIVYSGDIFSQLFQNQRIPYELKESCTKLAENEVYLNHIAVIDKYTFSDFGKLYAKMYSELCGPKFLYETSFSSKYSYDIASGLINECDAVFIERANEKLKYESIYKIKVI